MMAARLGGTLLLLILIGAVVKADPTWDTGYPKSGTNTGEIDVKGTYTLPTGWQTTGSLYVTLIPKGGGDEVVFTKTIPGNQTGKITWSTTCANLKSMQEYNVYVAISTENQAHDSKKGATESGSAKAK